ncbi:MAG: hydrogenase expression/formation protein HypE [Gammaproteobacteria bacterium]|nr:hydrogenase expression/formation protein HypE [Gammaproteobacteria bacterium]
MKHITLAHGNGGHYMRQLIEEVFAVRLANPVLDATADAVTLPELHGELLMSVDGFTVKPLEFPGGNIGSLAVHGTVNDLSVCGAIPRYLSLSAIIEEGFELEVLERIIASMADAAREAGVQIACGDTKVVPKGEGSGVYFTTTGIGVRKPGLALSMRNIRNGDSILVSGPVGDHGAAILLAREQFGLRGELRSDAASVLPLCQALYDLPGLRFMRDPTRGGLATVLHEMHKCTSFGIRVRQSQIPIRDPVASICEILGYDPVYLACEGRVVAVVDSKDEQPALARWQLLPQGKEARIIGRVDEGATRVILETAIGGERVLQELEDDPLPRIC